MVRGVRATRVMRMLAAVVMLLAVVVYPSDGLVTVAEAAEGESVPMVIETATVSGTVTDTVTHDPIEGASVSYSGWASYLQTTTAADGSYSFEIAAGDFDQPFQLFAWDPSGAHVQSPWLDSGTAPAAGGTVVVHIMLDPAGSISGTVTDEVSGTPIGYARVTAYGTVLYGSDTFADENGDYTLTGLGSDDWEIVAGATGYVMETYPTRVALPPGGDVSGIDLALAVDASSTEAMIAGVVKDAFTGDPVPRMTVSAISTAGFYEWSGTSRGDGYYTIGINAGTYDLILQASGSSDYVDELRTGVTVSDGEIMVVDLLLHHFVDVEPGVWFFDHVEAILAAGLTSGYDDGTYRPAGLVSRAEMAVFLVRALDGPDAVPPKPAEAPFSDVPVSHWASEWIGRLKDLGITTGNADGTYRPEGQVSRAEMAVFLDRAIDGPLIVPPKPSEPSFPDVPVSHWASGWIDRLVELGVTAGYLDGTYQPERLVDRGEMATFLDRAFLGG